MSNENKPNTTVEDARLQFLVSVDRLLRASRETERERDRLMAMLTDGPPKMGAVS